VGAGQVAAIVCGSGTCGWFCRFGHQQLGILSRWLLASTIATAHTLLASAGLGILLDPGSDAFERRGDAQDIRLSKPLSDDLQSDREPVIGESGGD